MSPPGDSNHIETNPRSDDRTDETSVEAVVTAVADAKDVSPAELSPPLYNVIDPDALEAFVDSLTGSPGESSGRIEFSYSGYEVTVTGSGVVSVTPIESIPQ